jgi:hypothetical protein
MTVTSVLWRRLDTPGHDACRLTGSDNGWQLDGTAVFRHNGLPALLAYRLRCDLAWRTQQGQVRGWLDEKPVEFTITRTAEGIWTLNDAVVPGLESYADLDFGFTPATNLSQLRRVALAQGQAAEVPVAWLDVSSSTLEALPQRYERRTGTTYWYTSPSADYAGLLEVTPAGFIGRYPDLWEAEP